MLKQAARAAITLVGLSLAALSSPQGAPKGDPVPPKTAQKPEGTGAPAAPKGELSERDLKELGIALARALDPEKQDYKDKDKSLVELKKLLEKAGKTKNSKDPLQGGLSLTTDLSKALHLAAEYKMEKLKPGQVSTTNVADKGEEPVTYALWVPKSYRANLDPYPLLLCFPGMKDGKVLAGDAFIQDNWMDSGLREKALIAALNLPADPKSWTEGKSSDGKPGGVEVAMRSLNDIRNRYAIDFDRVFLVGREAGVAAALSLGGKFSQNFAGVVGRSGDVGTTLAGNFRNLPTFFSGAGAEAGVFLEGCKKEGFENCTIKSDGTEADAWAWMAEHPRVSNPTRVTLYPGKTTRSYWIKIPATDVEVGQAKIEGEIDRAKNTITINATGVRQMTLMLNDVLVDLDKPVKLVLNGSAQEAVLPRSLEDTVDMMYRAMSEPGRVYVVRKDFDLPAPK